MPFVPLGSRKNHGVILDEMKAVIDGKMHALDNATVKFHHQVMPGATGYKFANHPITMGPVRQPPPPFATANKPWAPPEDEPDGMAAARDNLQAPMGALNEGSHRFLAEGTRANRSTGALLKTMGGKVTMVGLSGSVVELQRNMNEEGAKSLGEQAREQANPVSIELRRWQKMAKVTERDLNSMPPLDKIKERKMPEKPVASGGLVNFPKYMLFENSHLKTTEFQRYCDGEAADRAEKANRATAAEEAMARGELTPGISSMSPSRESGSMQSGAPDWPPQVSWGAPRLRGPSSETSKQYAGSAMPHGKSMKSSNPFRMG